MPTKKANLSVVSSTVFLADGIITRGVKDREGAR
jgi:hypothetical protein